MRWCGRADYYAANLAQDFNLLDFGSKIPKSNDNQALDTSFNAPITTYPANTITIPLDTLVNLAVSIAESSATFTWQASSAPDVTSYRLYLTDPDGATFVSEIPNAAQKSYTQQGLYISGDWQASISAVDINGNDSARSPEVSLTINLDGTSDTMLYLPLITRSGSDSSGP